MDTPVRTPGNLSSVRGTIYRMIKLVEQLKSPFAVSRLIMMTGIPVRQFDATAEDDPVALVKIEKALRELLTADELADLDQQMRQKS